MSEELRILGIAGSIRKKSFNRAALRAAVQLAPEGMKIEVFDLEGIPPFNADLEGEMPAIVTQFKEKIRSSDAILICTPEYNYSVPGVLKNAIDWASRPPGDNAWNAKPVAIMGASTGRFGTARAQYHLRQSLVYLNMYVLNRPEVMISEAAKKFDAEGNLTDEETRKRIVELLTALGVWMRGLRAGGIVP
jgi:chromate reductase